MDDLNVQNTDTPSNQESSNENCPEKAARKRKKLGIKSIILIIATVITGIAAIGMAFSFGFTYIKEQKAIRADIDELLDKIVIPDNVPCDTWEDKNAIMEKMEKEGVAEWGRDFLRKVAKETPDTDNYWIHQYTYLPFPHEYLPDPRIRVDLYLSVNNNTAYGTLELDPRMHSSICRDLDMEKEDFVRKYEIYRQVYEDGSAVTYIKNDGQWYSYRSNKTDNKNVTITPKEVVEMYTSEQVNVLECAMKSNEKIATTISIDSVASKYIHQAIHPSFYNYEFAVSANHDYQFRSANALTVKLDLNKLNKLYGHSNDKLLSALAQRRSIVHSGYGIELDKYDQIENITIPQEIIDNAVEITSLDFIYDYVYVELNLPYVLNDNGVVKVGDIDE